MLPMYEIRKSELSVKLNDYSLEFPEHMHKYIEIIYVFDGAQRVCISGRDYLLKAGDCAAVLPDTVHSCGSVDGISSRVLIIIAAPKIFGSVIPDLRSIKIDNPILTPELICPELKAALSLISPTQKFEQRFSWACVILSYILDAVKPRFSSSVPVEDISFKLIKYIEEHFTDDISRLSAARYLGVSECLVSRICSENLKMDFRKYLSIIRAEYAAQLIRRSDRSFEDISQMAGFGSFRSFSRAFKELYGMTPRDYRNGILRLTHGSD